MLRRRLAKEADFSVPTLTMTVLIAYWMFLPAHLSAFEPSKAFAIDIVCLFTLVNMALQGDARTLGVSLRLWWTASAPWQRTGAVALIALALEIVLSTALSLVPRTSLAGTLNRGQGTAHILLVAGMVATAWPNLARGRSFTGVLGALAVGGVIPAVITITQAWGYDPVSGTALQLDRPTATFGNAVILGSMVAVSALAAAELALASSSSRHIVPSSTAAEGGSFTGLPRADDASRVNPNQLSLEISRRILHIRRVVITLGALLFPATLVLSAIEPDCRWVVFPACIASAGSVSNWLLARGGSTQAKGATTAWICVAILCLVAVGLSRSRGPIIALGAGTAIRVAVHELVTGAKRSRAFSRALGVGLVLVTVTVLFGAIGPIAGLIEQKGIMAKRPDAETVVAGQIAITLRDSWSTRLDVAGRAISIYRTGRGQIDETIASRAGLTVGMQRQDIQDLILAGSVDPYPREIRRAFGFGPDSQAMILGIDGAGLTFDRAHNAVLDVLITLGIAGLGLMAIAGTSVMMRARTLTCDAASRLDGSGSLLGMWTVIGLSSLTGVDSTGQSLVTWVLAGAALAQISKTDTRYLEWAKPDTHASTHRQNGVRRSVSREASLTVWTLFGVILMVATWGLPETSANNPMRWGCATFTAITLWAHGYQHAWNQRRSFAVGVSCFIACLIAYPLFGALSAGADARHSIETGEVSKGRATHLERAIVNDPGQFTYWFLRER
ncbi:MAG: hypothetical protein EBT09_03330 [Actinobacteria bacterium]|nr:hypothetical protein [Actinomycetota bacterium]